MNSLVSFLFLLLSLELLLAQQPPLQPIGEVLMTVLDTNKDGKVEFDEVTKQLQMLKMLFQEDTGGEYLQLVNGLEESSPKLFELLDSNGDKKLSRKDLGWVTKFEKSLPAKATPCFRDFLRECFATIDTDEDNRLSTDEWNAIQQPQISTLTAKFHEIFPLRETAEKLESFLSEFLVGQATSSKEKVSGAVFGWLDADNDGLITREEVGKAYGKSAKKWMSVSKQIKEMGPMMAMFGGGMGGMNTEL